MAECLASACDQVRPAVKVRTLAAPCHAQITDKPHHSSLRHCLCACFTSTHSLVSAPDAGLTAVPDSATLFIMLSIGDVAFSGSAVKQGERHAVVYATGINTFFGRAAALISATNNVANLQV